MFNCLLFFGFLIVTMIDLIYMRALTKRIEKNEKNLFRVSDNLNNLYSSSSDKFEKMEAVDLRDREMTSNLLDYLALEYKIEKETVKKHFVKKGK